MTAIFAMPFFAVAAGLWSSGRPVLSPLPAIPQTTAADREYASFPLCSGPVRLTCVIDGDTIWYRGDKIRLADINAPETSSPQCREEAELGHRATMRLQALLNRGAFTLAPNPEGRAFDKYGRRLKLLVRGGRSLGLVLVDEGLAERWKGYRGSWCRA